jgi:beta-glucosidase
MPYYGMPVGLTWNGEPVEEVGFGFNRQMLTGLLREELGFRGVICTDWGLVTGTVVGGRPLPARAWGVERLDAYERVIKIIEAGADQLGGESLPHLVVRAVEEGRITPARVDESVRRLLLVKFQLGLFDDPFVDEDAAADLVGNPDFRAAGRRAQAESMVLVSNDRSLLPRAPGGKVYVEGLPADAAARLGEVVADPADADVAVVRFPAPYEPRDDLFLESFFHQGSLDYRPGLVARLRDIAASTPLVLVPNLERPAILTPLADAAGAIVAEFGSSPDAVADVLTGAVAPAGVLPFEVPRSMDAVRSSAPDVPDDTADALYPARHGLRYDAVPKPPESGDGADHGGGAD